LPWASDVDRFSAPEDKPLVADSFKRLTEESRYRRFFTTKNELSPAELAYLVDVDRTDHEAIIAIDPQPGRRWASHARFARRTMASLTP
jgi:hypothetical protein